jgi:hypothetical protein
LVIFSLERESFTVYPQTLHQLKDAHIQISSNNGKSDKRDHQQQQLIELPIQVVYWSVPGA